MRKKTDSPSSGLFRVKVYNEHGMAQRNGTGMFPREVMNRFPLLPLEEEGRLSDLPLDGRRCSEKNPRI